MVFPWDPFFWDLQRINFYTFFQKKNSMAPLTVVLLTHGSSWTAGSKLVKSQLLCIRISLFMRFFSTFDINTLDSVKYLIYIYIDVPKKLVAFFFGKGSVCFFVKRYLLHSKVKPIHVQNVGGFSSNFPHHKKLFVFWW